MATHSDLIGQLRRQLLSIAPTPSASVLALVTRFHREANAIFLTEALFNIKGELFTVRCHILMKSPAFNY